MAKDFNNNREENKKDTDGQIAELKYIFEERYAICIESGLTTFEARQQANSSVSNYIKQNMKNNLKAKQENIDKV